MTRTMPWCTVFLEYVSVTSNGTNGWQRLLHPYDVAIITATSLSARIDENEAHTSWSFTLMASVFVHPRVTALSDLSGYIQCFPR